MVAQKIGKIGNFILKDGRKIGKSIALNSSTKIASLHPINYPDSDFQHLSPSTAKNIRRTQ